MRTSTSPRYARTLALGVALLCGHALIEPAGAVEPVGDAGGYRIETDTPQRLILQVTTRYRLGDNDTRTDARRLALQAAKVMAAERAGTYIESQTTVGGSQIKSEEIKTLSAAYMVVTVLSENAEAGPQGDLHLVLTIRADLDKTLLQQRIDSLLQNTEFRGQITALEAQNRRLKADLAQMNMRLGSSGQAARGASADPRYTLLKERSDVLAKIDGTSHAVKLIFERGTLYAMAQKAESEFDLAQRDIDDSLKYLVENTQVTVGEPKFKLNGDGTADVHVYLSWVTPFAGSGHVKDALSRWFVIGNGDANYVTVRKDANGTGRGKHAFAGQLFQKLVKKRVIVVVSLGEYSGKRYLGAGLSCFVSCGGLGEDDFVLRWNYDGKEYRILPGSGPAFTNPLVISRVPVQALQTSPASMRG